MEAHLSLGRLLAQLGNHERAVQHFDSALRARPEQPQALRDLADCQAALGRLGQAIASCEKAHALARASSDAPLVKQIERQIERLRRASKAPGGE